MKQWVDERYKVTSSFQRLFVSLGTWRVAVEALVVGQFDETIKNFTNCTNFTKIAGGSSFQVVGRM